MDARPITIAVDGMGGDYGLPVTLPSTIQFLSQKPEARCLLVGDEGAIRSAIAEQKPDAALLSRLEIVHASEAVGMDEPIAVAMRGKKDSSMRRSLECLLDGRAQACVSAGNTGALMALSRMLLKTMEGIDRPAIAAQIPNVRGGATMVLDLGANVDCSAEHLLQFAMMGAALSSALDQSRRPSIGLLNIGEEMIKGNDVVKQAGELLRSSSLNFVGNVEGKDIFSGTVDVVVCDGFVGNVALKTSEGLASMLSQTLREEYGRGPMSKLAALVSMPVIRRIRRRMDHRRYNGASLIGLRGIVFKSHGSADDMAFQAALARAADAVEHRLIDQIAQTLPEARALGHVNSAAAPSADAQAHAASIMPGSALAIGQVQSH
ncbi:MAG: phosphate acyltransferase PlsX [Betaproteobacteria bacterium]|nr:phosphate acyltransferase PlsX [Pseudomonadota bacterium]NBO11554.1 phosphate acyltransferase PlsX [Betaproteobacteria bacterium]NBO43347.1 phosphate acyltransferase PlsX [Betaproteobacteria bacterium]NBP09749.1 phosphate acyltransferase PlsX [Betaproteobacteria bacterium]NBP61142.1 phosphate acyltransferase PlsX [Betaproteobacteria bacterium]